MHRLDDFTNRHIGFNILINTFALSKNCLVQIFWPPMLKFSLVFSVNAGLILDPAYAKKILLWTNIYEVKYGTCLSDQKLALFNEHKSFVQGVAWDPRNEFAATLSTDR